MGLERVGLGHERVGPRCESGGVGRERVGAGGRVGTGKSVSGREIVRAGENGC